MGSPSPARLAQQLSLMRSSFATLTKEDGAYIQAGGGPGLFVIEYRDSAGQHHRASQSEPVVPFPDGTIISFSGGSMPLGRHEWFSSKQVVKVFTCFLSGNPLPGWLTWHRLAPDFQ